MMWQMFGPQHAQVLRARFEGELKELNSEKVIDENKKLPARESGSLEWRSSRGEMGL